MFESQAEAVSPNQHSGHQAAAPPPTPPLKGRAPGTRSAQRTLLLAPCLGPFFDTKCDLPLFIIWRMNHVGLRRMITCL